MCLEKEEYTKKKSLDLQSIQEYRITGCKLKELLEECRREQMHISFQDRSVEAEWMYAIYEMIEKRMREELKVEQLAGIQRALKNKAEGKGRYGRPRATLPPDFERQVKKRIRNKEDLSGYCKEIDMKRSTFYKWVKVYRNSWKDL